jgi:hypothetical protein
MFEAVYTKRSNEELLSYWLDLQREVNANLESDYERAWNGWTLDQEAKETKDLASSLESFLYFSGRYHEFTERLARLSLAVHDKLFGPEHPDTGRCLKNLALLLHAKGGYDAACAFSAIPRARE